LAERLQPESPDAQLLRARIHEQRGELEQAEAAYRLAIRVHPERTRAACLLTRLLGSRLPDADLAEMEKRLDTPLFDDMRAGLLFALASVMDAKGDYTRAAGYAREANAISLKLGNRRDPYVPALHRQFVDGVIRVFTPDFFARMAGAGLDTDRPIFVFGLPRSGTTLVEQILASHPQVHGAGELQLGYQSFMAIPAALSRAGDPLACAADLNAAAVRRLAEQHLAWLAARDNQGSRRIVDKMPSNYLYLGLLTAMFPRAAFIHCRRELRDVAVSCWLTEFQWLQWTNDFEHIATRFQEYLRLMEHWRRVLPVKVHQVDYESLVADLEPAARRLVEACGLPWDPACLEFHRSHRPVRTASALQVRKPIYRQSVGRWKHYEHELAELFARLPGFATQ
jgi:tetratricopeptide (TPR) repeat protein